MLTESPFNVKLKAKSFMMILSKAQGLRISLPVCLKSFWWLSIFTFEVLFTLLTTNYSQFRLFQT